MLYIIDPGRIRILASSIDRARAHAERLQAQALRPAVEFELIEDNAGGLHLHIPHEPVTVSGLERQPRGVLDALEDIDNWPDWTDAECYGAPRPLGTVIADDQGIYPERMGVAGRLAFQEEIEQC